MCGIAGLVDRSGTGRPDGDLVEAMLATLAHRGPDDDAIRVESHAVLGARRLSIIDVAGGKQPVANEDGSIVAVQNGEIYNYLELREQLRARGHRLRSDGDTETIVHLYEDLGDRFVDALRGMFAIAIWDARRDRLVLARDRLGKKPLYWRLRGGRFTFGSELRAILADPAVQPDLDPAALAAYLAYQYVPAPASILAGINKLPPASTLVWEGPEPQIERYWVPRFEPKTDQSADDDRDQFLEILRDAVRLRLRSDVPVGAFLSGGIDSSVVTALMAEQSVEPIRTFTIGFDRSDLDERPYAAAVAQRFGTRHTSEVVSLDAVELLPAFAHAFDEPFGDPSAIPTLRVAQLAARELKVVLTGDGGDEILAGYDRYVVDERLARWRRRGGGTVGAAARMAFRATAGFNVASKGRRVLSALARDLGGDPDSRYDLIMRVGSPALVQSLLGTPQPTRALGDGLSGPIPEARLDRLLRLDSLTYLPEDLLVKVDRATMASSLEARSPLLDQELFAFAAHLPAERKLVDGQGKELLREIARRILPDGIADRPKQGFRVPIDDWFDGAIGDRFAELALAPDGYLRDVVDVDVAGQLFRNHRSRSGRHGRPLWLLLALELWGREWRRTRATSLAADATAA